MKKIYFAPGMRVCSFWAEKNFMSLDATGQDLDDPKIIDPFEDQP